TVDSFRMAMNGLKRSKPRLFTGRLPCPGPGRIAPASPSRAHDTGAGAGLGSGEAGAPRRTALPGNRRMRARSPAGVPSPGQAQETRFPYMRFLKKSELD